MGAIYQREMQSFFFTPTGYIFLAVFYFFCGFYFAGYSLKQNTSDLSEVFSSMFTICVFLIPLLTMRMLSEEKKNKTNQLILTAPVSLWGLVFGKYFAALSIFGLGASIMILFGIVFTALGTVNWILILGHMIGLLLLGASLIAIGMFISVLTENQIIAAVGAIASGVFLVMADVAASMLPEGILRRMLDAISFTGHYSGFTRGLINLEDVVFFLSAVVFFNFATIMSLDRSRWK